MTWSYSRISSFSECPYRWFLTYLYENEDGSRLIKKGGFFSDFGTYMHLIMQMYLEGVLVKEDLPIFYLSHFSEHVIHKAPSYKIYRNYYKQGFHYLDQFSYPDRTTLGVEKKVSFTFAGKPWTGFIDAVSMSDNGKLIITDHKSRALKPRTKRSKPTKSDLELDQYLRQLYVYSASVKDEYARFPDILEFNCFRTGTMIQEAFDLETYRSVEKWAKEEICSITKNNLWTAKPDYWRCKYLCDVCEDCEYKNGG